MYPTCWEWVLLGLSVRIRHFHLSLSLKHSEFSRIVQNDTPEFCSILYIARGLVCRHRPSGRTYLVGNSIYDHIFTRTWRSHGLANEVTI